MTVAWTSASYDVEIIDIEVVIVKPILADGAGKRMCGRPGNFSALDNGERFRI